MPGESNDRRVRRTKRLLREGLIQLMQQKPVKDISVKELSDLVDINRGTFYLYYRDIFDMVLQLENELFAQIEQIIIEHAETPERSNISVFFTALFTYIKDNRVLFQLLLGSNGDSQFQQRLSTIVRDNYRKELHETKTDIPDADFNHKYSFAVFGVIGLVHFWLEQDCAEPVEALATTAAQMTAGVLFKEI